MRIDSDFDDKKPLVNNKTIDGKLKGCDKNIILIDWNNHVFSDMGEPLSDGEDHVLIRRLLIH
jgi:hypothetical protein